jgi:predicted alpha/beta-hydrolase family hydrolase
MSDFLIDGPAKAKHTFVFAHGAGGPMDSAWMARVARGIAAGGVRVVRFEFPYMAARRRGEKKGGAPDRAPILLDSFRNVVAELGGGPAVVIGGKSMGGRMATMIADELHVRGVVCFGYPFHPPGQPAKLRTEHLQSLVTPTLILQGSRDIFGNADEVPAYELSDAIRVEWIRGGDHSLKPNAAAGVTERENIEHAIEEAVTFITTLR